MTGKRDKICIVWPAQAVITESLFRHFSMVAEVAGYLCNYSEVVKCRNLSVCVEDCAVVPHTAMGLARIVQENDLIALAINMNNVREAVDTASFFKSVNRNKPIIAYGEAVACCPSFFEDQSVFDYVVVGGQFELGIEYAIFKEFDYSPVMLPEYDLDHVFLSGKRIIIKDDYILPEEKWGMPQLDILPIPDYLRISNGELHITACKGCPFQCDFCNEIYVSGGCLRYRISNEIVSYLTEIAPKYGAQSVYLDSSTFTYDHEWVMELCSKLKSTGKQIIPWKTCTRLDCIDDEMVSEMGSAGCRRISIGVESLISEVQERNNKRIDMERMKHFAEICKKNQITPRAMFIIGLKGQTKEDIIAAKSIISEYGIQTRFRLLQDYSILFSGKKIGMSDFDSMNRWSAFSPFWDMDVNVIRSFEYPENRNQLNYS